VRKLYYGTATLAVVAAAAVAVSTSGAAADSSSTCTTHTAAFGWEGNNLHNHGANLVLPVTQDLRLTSITVDYSMTRVPGQTDGWREALAYVAIDPTGTTGSPTYQPTVPGAPGWGASTRNGAVSHGGGMSDRLFAQAILKNGYSGAVITQQLDFPLSAGDKVWVHADAYGAATDVEAQGSLTYEICTP